MPISVIPDVTGSLVFGNVGTEKKALKQITLLASGSSLLGPQDVQINVQVAVTSPDGGTIQVFSPGWSSAGVPITYTRHVIVDENEPMPIPIPLPLVVGAIGVDAGDVIDGTITVSGPDFLTTVLPFHADCVNTAEDAIALHMVLDCTASMSSTVNGSTNTRAALMKQACRRATALLTDSDWVGIFRLRGSAGEIFKVERYTGAHKSQIDAALLDATFNPITTDANPAVIKNGVAKAALSLNGLGACAPPKKAIVVLTDGLGDPAVPPTVTSFPIGLGTMVELSAGVATLASCTSTGNFFLLDAAPSDGSDDAFKVDKYLLQAVAAVAGIPTVSDPHGTLKGTETVRVPFQLSDTDSKAIVLVLVDDHDLVDAELHPPAEDHPRQPSDHGQLGKDYKRPPPPPRGYHGHCREEPIDVSKLRGASRIKKDGYVGIAIDRSRRADPALRTSGQWEVRFKLSENAREQGSDAKGVRYSVVVFARSDLKFNAELYQDHYGIGATLFLTAHVTEYGGPVTGSRAHVFAEITFPDGSTGALRLPESFAAGRYTAEFRGTQPGVYRVRFRAIGYTMEHVLFHRELTYTAVIQQCAQPCRQHSAATEDKEEEEEPVRKQPKGVDESEEELPRQGMRVAQA